MSLLASITGMEKGADISKNLGNLNIKIDEFVSAASRVEQLIRKSEMTGKQDGEFNR